MLSHYDGKLNNEEIRKLLMLLPGYNNTYGFIDVRNIGDIMFSQKLEIRYDAYSPVLINYLPFLRSLSCKVIRMNNDDELVLEFDRSKNHVIGVEYTDKAFEGLLLSSFNTDLILVPTGFCDIAITTAASRNIGSIHRSLILKYNYYTILWDDVSAIMKQYYLELSEPGNDKDSILNEMMNVSQEDNTPIANILHFICQNRVTNLDICYDDAWNIIHDKYREFVSLVLDSIHTSETDV